MEIVLFKIEDYAEVYDFWLNTPGMGLNDADDSIDGMKRFIKRNPTTFLVAKTGGKVVGTVLGGHDGRRGYIYHMAVSRDVRNQGVGKALLDQVLDALKDEGIAKVALVVYQSNLIGNDFWEKRGFIKREDLYYRNYSLVDWVSIDT